MFYVYIKKDTKSFNLDTGDTMFIGCEIPKTINIDMLYTFFKTSFKNDYSFKGESHNFWEMVFVCEGTVGVTAGSDVYVLERGQAVIHKPNEFHRIWSEFDTNPTVIVISFSASHFPEVESRIINVDSQQINTIDRLHTVACECFRKTDVFISEIKEDCEYDVARFKAQLELFIIELVKKQIPENSSGVKSAEIYSAAVKFMEEHPGAGLCIEDIARECSISGAYLKKIFMKYSGCGVIQYYNRLRARLACGYLINGRSVKEIAIILGFGDQNYFSTFFKRVMGVSPTKYRNDAGRR